MPSNKNNNRSQVLTCCCYLYLALFLLSPFLLCDALPGEEALPSLLAKMKLEASKLRTAGGRISKRAPGDECPIHPKPLPQEVINKFNHPPPLQDVFAEIKTTIQNVAKQNFVQAVSVGVVYDQELIWNYNLGLVDPNDPTTAVTADTPFRIGSITKALTNLLLMKLRDEGKVALDDPVRKLVPEFTVRNPYDNSPGITWRSLASQNSGLQGAVPCDFFTIFEPIFNDACDITNEEAWKRLAEEDVMGPMYTKPHYADSGYAVIGRALESVMDGKKYEQYITDEIFKPLGMNAFFDYSARASEVPLGYHGNTSFASFISQARLNWAAPTGQLYASVNDLQKLASLFFQGDANRPNKIGVFSSSLREMLQPVSVNDDAESAYGFPWEIVYSRAVGLSSRYWLITKTGSVPGYSGTLFMIPEMKLGLIVLLNNDNPATFSIPAITSLIPAFEKTFTQYALPPPTPGDLKRYEGVYLASALMGLVTANVTIKAMPDSNVLEAYAFFGQMGLPVNATWVKGNTFQMRIAEKLSCLYLQAGWNDAFMYFKTDSWTGEIDALTIPGVDPLYGMTFYKQGASWWRRERKPIKM